MGILLCPLEEHAPKKDGRETKVFTPHFKLTVPAYIVTHYVVVVVVVSYDQLSSCII